MKWKVNRKGALVLWRHLPFWLKNSMNLIRCPHYGIPENGYLLRADLELGATIWERFAVLLHLWVHSWARTSQRKLHHRTEYMGKSREVFRTFSMSVTILLGGKKDWWKYAKWKWYCAICKLSGQRAHITMLSRSSRHTANKSLQSVQHYIFMVFTFLKNTLPN